MHVSQEQLQAQEQSSRTEQSRLQARMKELEADRTTVEERIKSLAEKGHPSLRNAPYFIVVAEKHGIPPAALQSLAHCLQNMWLKATALGLAFQLISATESMSEDPGFMRLLGLPAGRFLLDGCAVGFPAAVPALPARPDAADITTWL